MMISLSFYRKRRKASSTSKNETQESDYNQYQEILDIKKTIKIYLLLTYMNMVVKTRITKSS